MENLQTLASQLLADYNIDTNNGTQDVGTVECYDIHTSNLVCPCCNCKLKLTDSAKAEFMEDDIVQVKESVTMNENKLSDYLLEIIENAAQAIYEDELDTNEPELDMEGHIIDDYSDRFRYLPASLKKIIKVKSNAIANMVKQNGIEISPFYIENEIIQILKSYSNYK